MYKDCYGLELSCASEEAQQAYSAGIDNALRLDEPGITELTRATTQDEEFALAQAALGRQLQIHGFASAAVEHLDKSVSLKTGTTLREQSAIDVITASASFDPEALRLAQSHVENYPRDIFVLAHLAGPFGLLAFSGQRDWRRQNVALLQTTRAAYPSDNWWHMTTRSFVGAEVGELRQARDDGERAWSLCENGNCAHSLAHVHFEAGAVDEGVAFINDWKTVHGDKSDMRHHLMWHLALLARESGACTNELMEIYERELDPTVSDPMPLTTFSDNAAFLWRCYLSGMDIPDNIAQDLVRYADTHYPVCGFAFADIHRVMSTALLNNREQQQGLIDRLARLSLNSGTELTKCMLQFAKGFNAFADSNYAAAVNLLEPVVSDSVLLGGSNPQRRIIEETLLEACMRAGEKEKARAILQSRKNGQSTFDRGLLGKIDAQS